jgi:prepilin-type N-terminal cleavage/methylation domain-containing protein
MTLSKMKQLRKDRGFTIVELLIVIVVIGILAAITIVAYNGVQNRAKTTSAQSAAANMQKKIEAFNGATGAYPTQTTNAAFTTAMNGQTESALGTLAAGTPSATNGQNTVEVSLCATVNATGYRVRYWDFGTAALSTTTYTGNANSTACAAWTPLT